MLNKTILSYKGPLTFSTIDKLLTQFKMAAQEHELTFRTYKKVLSVMIEAMENIYKYSDQYYHMVDVSTHYLPSVRIEKKGEQMKLTTTNPIKNEHIEELRYRIDCVNNRTREELKELYVETITNGEFSAKGGAGLGFVEMAKTSGNNLRYSFHRISDAYSTYTFAVTFYVG